MTSLVLLDRVYDTEEVHIVNGFLEANGIDTLLCEAQTLNVMPLHRIALGGYRILVPDIQLEDAKALLAPFKNSVIQKGVTHDCVTCPFCGGEYLEREKSKFIPLAIWLFFGMPLWWNSGRFRCNQCKLTFKKDQFGAYA